VTREAARTPVDEGTRLRLLIDGVEDDALPRIFNGDLEQRRAADVADRDGIVEVNCPRIRRLGGQGLYAGFRHHQHLRFDWDVQRVQHRSQVASGFIERNLRRAILDAAFQIGDKVAGRLRVVGDRWMVGRVDGRMVGKLADGCGGNRHDSSNDRGQDRFHGEHPGKRNEPMRVEYVAASFLT
jgi:hypothetical protein